MQKETFGNVPVTIYQPENDNNGAVVYVHGGFWLIYDAGINLNLFFLMRLFFQVNLF